MNTADQRQHVRMVVMSERKNFKEDKMWQKKIKKSSEKGRFWGEKNGDKYWCWWAHQVQRTAWFKSKTRTTDVQSQDELSNMMGNRPTGGAECHSPGEGQPVQEVRLP